MVLMTALLLHIGSPKAGSSAIQASLEQCSKQLCRSSGVLVLPSNPYNRPMPSGFLAACHLSVEQLPRYLAARHRRDPEQFQQDLVCYQQLLANLLRFGVQAHPSPLRARLRQLKAALLRRPARPALLSSEYLFRLPPAQIARLRDWFEAQGVRRFRLLVYVREPISAYGSFLQQWLRLSDDYAPYNPWLWHYQVKQQLEAWEGVFGPEALVVRPFEREQLVGGSVVADFYNQCSRWFDQPISGPEVSAVNQSLSIEALTLVQELLQAVPPSRRLESDWTSGMAKFLRLLRQQSAALPCAPVQVQPAVCRLVRDRHSDDMAWLAERHGIHLTQQPDAEGGEGYPPWREISSLNDLLQPPANSELIEQLRQRQLEAVVREGLR
jgi:hypothetical protein